jgi:hypothetical protein
MAGTVSAFRRRKDLMRLSAAATTAMVTLLGSALAGCSSATEPGPAVAEVVTVPSPSAAPAVRFVLPAELAGLPRQQAAKWTKEPKSMATFLEGKVLSPTGSVAAAYLDPDDTSETIELSAAAGRVADPAGTLRQLTGNLTVELTDVRPADPGTPGGVGTCGVSKEASPAVRTLCHWAEPGSVGSVTFWSRKDKRAGFAEVRAQLQP